MTKPWTRSVALVLGLCCLTLAAAADDSTIQIPDGTPQDMLAAINKNVRQAKTAADFETLIQTTEKIATHKDATTEQKTQARSMGLSLYMMGMRANREALEPKFLAQVEKIIKENPDAEIAGTASAMRWNHKYARNPEPTEEGTTELFTLAKKYPKNNMVIGLFMTQGMKLKNEPDFTAFVERLTKENMDTDIIATVHVGRWNQKYMAVQEATEESTAELFALAKQFPKNARVASMFMMQVRKIRNDEEAKAFLNKAVEVVAESPTGQRLKGMMVNRKLMGSTLEIAGPTLKGESFNLDSYKGKVVLVDFWATWCGPCVQELPHVKKVYEKYHDQGFEIVGISLDNSREPLEKFVAKENMPWVQIIFSAKDDMGWNNPLAKKYGVNSIPATFLVGRNGKVVARDLRGEANLDKAVAEALEQSKAAAK